LRGHQFTSCSSSRLHVLIAIYEYIHYNVMAHTTSGPLTTDEIWFTCVLEASRQAATESTGYCWDSTHFETSDECQSKLSYRPYNWQPYVSEDILLKLDTVLIGAGDRARPPPRSSSHSWTSRIRARSPSSCSQLPPRNCRKTNSD
jgi:hypothetical protein